MDLHLTPCPSVPAAPLTGGSDRLKPWRAPQLLDLNISLDTKGDPTISDDGLGDGLFS